jgi:hypothetical protein
MYRWQQRAEAALIRSGTMIPEERGFEQTNRLLRLIAQAGSAAVAGALEQNPAESDLTLQGATALVVSLVFYARLLGRDLEHVCEQAVTMLERYQPAPPAPVPTQDVTAPTAAELGSRGGEPGVKGPVVWSLRNPEPPAPPTTIKGPFR